MGRLRDSPRAAWSYFGAVVVFLAVASTWIGGLGLATLGVIISLVPALLTWPLVDAAPFQIRVAGNSERTGQAADALGVRRARGSGRLHPRGGASLASGYEDAPLCECSGMTPERVARRGLATS